VPWARFDDRYDDSKKLKRAWKACRAAVGLHAMAITYCARHHTDGVVDLEWIEEKLPKAGERKKALDALVVAGLFLPSPDGDAFVVNDYLEYNPSRAEIEAKRAQKAAAAKKAAEARWAANQ
jgi:hypothetical protein